MKVSEAVSLRSSIRAFIDKPVDNKLIKDLLGGSPKNEESLSYKDYKIIPKPKKTAAPLQQRGKL